VNTSIAKEELYRWLKTSVPDPEKNESWPIGFCHFPQYSKEYFEQLTAEQLVTKTTGGLRRTVWEKRRDRNDALDCRIYCRAAAASIRFETWSTEKWDELQRQITVEQPTPVSAARGSYTATPVPKFKATRALEDWLDG
jgi:phage terminase large subunit GpA-like protein